MLGRFYLRSAMLLFIAVTRFASGQLNCPSAEWLENGDFCYLLVKGASGRTFDEAKADCRGRDSGSDLLWLNNAQEQSWFTASGARQWNIKKDWNNCTTCTKGVEAAWIGLYRDTTDGLIKWTKSGDAVEITFNWWPSHPKPSPADFALMYDTGSALRPRTDITTVRLWHFCKVQHREPTTGSTPPPTTTLPYLGPCPSREWIENDDSCYLLVKGASGRTFDEAKADCRGRDSGSDLLWLNDAQEQSWFIDYTARLWGIKRDWANCINCTKAVEAAWIGAYRNTTIDQFMWTKNGVVVGITFNWWLTRPDLSPSDYVLMYDTGSALRPRTTIATSRYWHFCKVQLREFTGSTTQLATTTTEEYLGPCPNRAWVEHEAWCYLLVKEAGGRTFDQARDDCRSRGSKVDLLWIDYDLEATWWLDYSERTWNIKRDWAQCKDCAPSEGAWVGMFRDSAGDFRWLQSNESVTRQINWWTGKPNPSPADFAFLFDTGSQLRFRTAERSSRLWHFCKTQHGVYTGPSNTPPPTTSTRISTTTITTARSTVTTQSTTTTPATTLTTTKYVGNCPSGEWKEFEHSCYLLVKGSTGRFFSDARTDCRQRGGADLLWVTTDREMLWLRSSERQWNIRQDWKQCTSCSGVESAWFGLYRDQQDNQLKWAHNQKLVDVNM